MIRSIIISIALVALAGSASAVAASRYNPQIAHDRVVGGMVDSDGTVLRGSRFVVSHVSTGVYQIRFSGGQFTGGCPIMVATTAGNAYYTPFPEVSQDSCGDTFLVYMEYPGQNKFVDYPFMFIARATM
ncbi:MAG TPA: hypothetical protein VGK84_04465 [Candidatus Tumulicola sp.]